jgi:phosphohistidine swiveling domain-containing protein
MTTLSETWTTSLSHLQSPVTGGGKAWGLAQMARCGIRVPPGLVVHASVYESLASSGPVAARLARARRRNDPESWAAVGAGFLESSLPRELRPEIEAWLGAERLQDARLVVRSSAVEEDGERYSFAGIYDSFLNIQGWESLEEAILRCYASTWSTRARAYRDGTGEEAHPRMAVLISPLLDSRVSGVAVTCDPRSGDRDKILIEANFGLGESVVDGCVDPDEYVVDTSDLKAETVISRHGTKQVRAVISGDIGTSLKRQAENAAGSALSDAEVTELAILARCVEGALSPSHSPVDIEWAIDSKGISFLQARPITYLKGTSAGMESPQPVVWSNANLKDSYPNVQSTLGWSVISSILDRVLYTIFEAAGLKTSAGRVGYRLIEGRPYLNWSSLISQFIAMGAAPEEIVDTLGGHHPGLEEVLFKGSGNLRRASLIGRLRLVSLLPRACRDLRKHSDPLWKRADEELHAGYGDWSDLELIEAAREGRDRLVCVGRQVQLVNAASGSALAYLVRALRGLGMANPRELATELCSGTGQVTSAELGGRLRHLASLAEQNPAVMRLFEGTPLNVAGLTEGDTTFHEQFHLLIADYGHRAVTEMELAQPRWREDPSYLLEGVRILIGSGRSCRAQATPPSKRGALREIITRHPGRGLQVGLLTYLARDLAPRRENARSLLVKLAEPLRKHLLELGNRLAARGLILAAPDVFHCTWWDLLALARGHWDGAGLTELVTQRKQQEVAWRESTPPDVILEEGEGQRIRTAPVPATPAKSLLSGVGVSPGQARGCVLKMSSPVLAGAGDSGYVLVAPAGDPGWTPVLAGASALVMETGGYLSHCSVIARELGIPAVLNVPSVMSRLRSHDELLVDGTRGTIRLLGRAPSAGPEGDIR